MIVVTGEDRPFAVMRGHPPTKVRATNTDRAVGIPTVDFLHPVAVGGEEGLLEVRTGRCHLMDGYVSATGDAARDRFDGESRRTCEGPDQSCCDSVHDQLLGFVLELVGLVRRTRRFDERHLAPLVCGYKIDCAK